MLRLAVFLAVLAAMAALEALLPRRKRLGPRVARWATNMSFVALGAAVVRALGFVGSTLGAPLLAVAAAVLAERHGIGLLRWTGAPYGVAIVISMLALDFAIWFQHFAAHRYQWLWVVHRVHHADPEIDVTTALRFHPIEIALSMVWKVLWVLLLGAPPVAVVLFEVVLNAFAMFNHANLKLPIAFDRFLRSIIVTPDMHRVHHSILDREHRANFGFNLSVWDRLFGTYVPQPEGGHDGMTIGLPDHQSKEPTELWWSLRFPFRK